MASMQNDHEQANQFSQLALDPIIKPWDTAPLMILFEKAVGRV